MGVWRSGIVGACIPSVYLNENGDLLFAHPDEEAAWWEDDSPNRPTFADLLLSVGVRDI